MSQFTLYLKGFRAEPGDDSEALLEQILAAGLAEHGLEYEGLVSAHRNTVPIDADKLEELFDRVNGLGDAIYGNGFEKEVRELDRLQDNIESSLEPFQDEVDGQDSVEDEIRSLIREIEATIGVIEKSRPDNPEAVSYSLDDLRKQVADLKDIVTDISEQTDLSRPDFEDVEVDGPILDCLDCHGALEYDADEGMWVHQETGERDCPSEPNTSKNRQ